MRKKFHMTQVVAVFFNVPYSSTFIHLCGNFIKLIDREFRKTFYEKLATRYVLAGLARKQHRHPGRSE